MEKHVIARGALAGAIGGLFAFVFGRIMVEPIIGRAVAFEEARNAAEHAGHAGMAGMAEEPELFTRAVQENLGLGAGLILFGIAMGALFGVAYCIAAPKLAQWTPRTVALAVAGSLFAGLYALPYLKYPPNPPVVGDPDTIRERTGAYLLMVAICLALVAGAWVIGLAAVPRLGGYGAALAGGAVVLVGLTLACLLLPATVATPDGFNPDDLYWFRTYSFVAQAILWGAIGLVGAELLHLLTVRSGSRGIPATV
ncbi:CbtA family protein [Tsukamurella asaccharolytica]|uniref:CbtA family protein n=1 Tax=Tsukamurella asaccharolytica TaxID=2592067 RepID=A0A5C5R5P7_9ACTN|nr:CbtA family protein [Tsukamurella asaccharolytica]TWS17653.1 CbtA family protein [Tsukamurella asaccharolytica]